MRELPQNPAKLEAKKHLAWLIVSQFHGEEAADRALEAWELKAAGDDSRYLKDIALSTDALDSSGFIAAPNLLKELGLESSTSKARSVIKQGGFRIGPSREKIVDPTYMVRVEDGLEIRVGKLRYYRIRLKESAK